MSQKNQFNIHDKGDLPLGSNSDNLQVEQVKDKTTSTTKISKSRVRKAVKPTETVSSEGKSTTKTKTSSKQGIKTESKSKVKAETKPKIEEKSKHEEHHKSKKKLKTTLTSSSIEMEDLEVLNEQNIRQHRSRSRRNIVIISVLISLLVVAVAVIAIYAGFIRLKNNCFLHVHGASASYLVDGERLDEFRAPQGVRGNTVFAFDLDLEISGDREYNVRFKIDVFQSGKLLDNIIVLIDQDHFTQSSDGYIYSDYKMSGTIDLCSGVVLDIAYQNTLNIDNFKMEINTYLY